MRSLLICALLLSVSAHAAPKKTEVEKASRPTPPPKEYNVSFDESDFDTKPWLREFEYVVVINKAVVGRDQQSIRVYHNQALLDYSDIKNYMTNLNTNEYRNNRTTTTTSSSSSSRNNTSNRTNNDRNKEVEKAYNERAWRIQELGTKMWAPGVFKVSSGRDQFERKGEHHSQKDSWTVTPAGVYVPQYFARKHKSESYSHGLCDSFFGKLAGAVLQKELCTYMEHAVFFNGAIAIHKAIPGTEGALGEKASGGCVRLPAALAEFLYLNINASTGREMPLVSTDGNAVTDANGQIVRTKVNTSVWGNIPARGALIILQNKVVR